MHQLTSNWKHRVATFTRGLVKSSPGCGCCWIQPCDLRQGSGMRQAACIADTGRRRPASACRTRPWWTCSHGEVIHDVSALRAAGGVRTRRLFSCMCLLSSQRAASSGLFSLLSGPLCCWRLTWLLGVFSAWLAPSPALLSKMWWFVFPGDFKGKVMPHTCLIYIRFIDGDKRFISFKRVILE